MSKKQVSDLVERAAWTFVQGFIAGWAVTGFQPNKGALIGAGAAGISALKTWVKATM